MNKKHNKNIKYFIEAINGKFNLPRYVYTYDDSDEICLSRVPCYMNKTKAILLARKLPKIEFTSIMRTGLSNSREILQFQLSEINLDTGEVTKVEMY